MKLILSYLHSWFYQATFTFRRPSFERGNPITTWCDPYNDIHGKEINTRRSQQWLYGRFSFSIRPDHILPGRGNICPWLLQLDMDKVQEIDVVEFMLGRMYFSIYHNDRSSEYFDLIHRPVYKRFQTRLSMAAKWIKKCRIYTVEWTPNRVKWFIDGIPVAVSYVYIPVQPMYVVVTGLERGRFYIAEHNNITQ